MTDKAFSNMTALEFLEALPENMRREILEWLWIARQDYYAKREIGINAAIQKTLYKDPIGETVTSAHPVDELTKLNFVPITGVKPGPWQTLDFDPPAETPKVKVEHKPYGTGVKIAGKRPYKKRSKFWNSKKK
ncbi:MAG: hypothetical protein DMF62_02535 [Acidobacteria bacterium]|nr:MAG: hypothetical protein DMF62_02535 [Acidobacteriota bacterium]